MSEGKNNKDLIERFMTSLSDRVDEIANKTDADINRVLFRIVGNHIEVYEIDLNEEKVKSFLGSFKVENLKY
jgi:glutamate formiminotransferase